MNSKNYLFVLSASLCGLLTPMLQADVIANFDFASGSVSSSDSDINSTASDIALNFSVPGDGAVSSFTETVFYRSTGTGADAATALSNPDYVSFTVTIDTGFVLNLDSLDFDQLGTTNAPTGDFNQTTFVQTSIDGFGSGNDVASFSRDVIAPASGAETTFDSRSIDLTASNFQNIAGTLEVRFYLYDDIDNSAALHRLDNIVLNGTVSVIPEPSFYASIFGVLGLVFIAYRRKRIAHSKN